MPDVTEINALTGVVIERDYTSEELAQRAADAVVRAEREAEEAAAQAAKESAQAKLAALGLTTAEIAALSK